MIGHRESRHTVLRAFLLVSLGVGIGLLASVVGRPLAYSMQAGARSGRAARADSVRLQPSVEAVEAVVKEAEAAVAEARAAAAEARGEARGARAAAQAPRREGPRPDPRPEPEVLGEEHAKEPAKEPPAKEKEEPPATDEEDPPAKEAKEPPAKEPAPVVPGVYNGPDGHPLTKELVASHAKDNLVMVTWANDHYYDFACNWVKSLRDIGVDNYLVGAMDDELLEKLVADGVPTFAMKSGLTTKDFGWGTANFHVMGRKKIDLIKTFTAMGFDVLVSDIDTAWMRDPREYMNRYPEADILSSSDHLASTVKDDGLENPSVAYSPMNIGVMLFRHTAAALAEEWDRVITKDPKYWDQNAFNDLARKGGGGVDDRRLRKTNTWGLKIGILPVATFCSGHTYFVQRMHEKLEREAYVVHATFQFAGTPGKRHRLREAMLWHDPPEYYDPPGGLLVYRSGLSRSHPLVDGAPSDKGHFELANHQLDQVRSALAIAQALGRALVMPELWCGYDRWWAPHKGKIPGSQLDLPFRCPMDHYFDLEAWIRDRDPGHFGPAVPWREHSMLRNPRTPKEVAESRVLVDVDDGAERTELEGDTGVRRARLAGNLTDEAVVEALEVHSGAKVLEFTSMGPGTFGGFADPKAQERFHNRLKLDTGIWCCHNAHPGHVWYDMLHDVVPHVDRHNRAWDGPWKPKTGP
mmetsp:Transcript_24594/g.84113  ORF Transcript_24594/g.84113 Transcript_24594/m.84113 type:complete len:693 (+) Transcript_24594:292-2370(+)